MLLGNLFQGDIQTDPNGAIQELMRAILMRAQFVPGVRHALGWCGLKQSVVSSLEGWTARTDGNAGVFGICFNGTEPIQGWAAGTFNLYYFPNADEALVERCSLHAAAYSQRNDYMSLVRDFMRHEEMASLFSIGTLFLALDGPKQALYLGVESLTKQRSIARDGIELSRDECIVQAIKPGGYDQDFPALSVTMPFFDVLASSVTFHLEQPPLWMIEQRFPGMEIVYDHKGTVQKNPAADIDQVVIGLGYGKGLFDNLFKIFDDTIRVPSTEIRWQETETVPPDYEHMRWWSAHHTSDYKTLDKKCLGIDERPPLIILAGFLGAGKTSFLQHFIEYQTQRSRFVAVIQNEIGEVGLDGKLLDYAVTEIDEGCVCCSLIGNLKRAVNGILSSFQPEFIILETTGVANPLNLLDEISEVDVLVRYDCTVTVVDALNLDYTLSNFRVASDQIRAADVLLLNKCDLVNEASLQKAHKQIQEINPKAIVFLTTWGDLNPALIFDTEDRCEKKIASSLVTDPRRSVHSSHVHDGLFAKTLIISDPLNRNDFLSSIESLPPTVFRIKGIIEFSDAPQPVLFQYVAGRFELSLFPQPDIADRFLNFIIQGESPDLVGEVCKIWKTDKAITNNLLEVNAKAQR